MLFRSVNFRDTLDITDLNNTVHTSMKGLVRDFSAETMGDSVRLDSLNDVRSSQTPTTNSDLQKGSNRDTVSSSLNQNTPGSNRRPNPASPQHQTHRSDINPTPTRSPSLGNEQIHVVKAGENLYRIGQIYHVSHEAIAKRNHLKNPTAIRPGQKLVIPK